MTNPPNNLQPAIQQVYADHRRIVKEKNRQINALKAEKGELQRALQGRDEARGALRARPEVLAEPRRLTLDAMTAREHLDAARNAGHPLPKGATIPEGAAFWVRSPGESWEFVSQGPPEDFDTSPFPATQYVLVDPPTPPRPEGAERAEAVLNRYWRGDIDGDDLADRIAEEMNR